MEAERIRQFIDGELKDWQLAADNHARLADAECRRAGVYILQHNPSRIRSTAAATDTDAVSRRPCFLCAANRPAGQGAIRWRDYDILLNPYPIFRDHLTIAATKHRPQRLDGHLDDFLALARELHGMTVFFNGARCGASAPDHLHFQAVPSDCLPIWEYARHDGINRFGSTGFYHYRGTETASLIRRLLKDDEMTNVLVRCDGASIEAIVIPRRSHRPGCYHDGTFMVSPASIDVSGVVITPRRDDFERLQESDIDQIMRETCFSAEELQPTVAVGITTAPDIKVERHDDGTFTLHDVVIGRQFHWQQRENQRFSGDLELRRDASGLVTAINRLPVEDYLLSVISSEMSAESSEEFLCAHAVISRSWLLAQIDRTKRRYEGECSETAEETVRWYDHDDHTGFDVCADDHCQRYQGIARATTPQVAEALRRTRGIVLTQHGVICDARFSKCCGGMMEEFATCWQPADVEYLKAVRDILPEEPAPDLTTEEGARRWITSRPRSFCDTTSPAILRRILNSYDRATTDFYRWTVEYTDRELAGIIRAKTSADYGRIIDLNPLHRGKSGRIDRLEIVGTNRRHIIGKELEIRRTLSPSHLYSSAFIAEGLDRDADGIPARWRIRGAGWGHGVGLCQIGAAVMASEGYDFRRILSHYFPGATLTKLY